MLVHALTSGGWMPSEAQHMIATAEEQLRKLLPPESCPEGGPRVVAEFGSPADVILRAAYNYDVDLIVMGARPSESIRTATRLPWSVAHAVVHEARCPVLTVRE